MTKNPKTPYRIWISKRDPAVWILSSIPHDFVQWMRPDFLTNGIDNGHGYDYTEDTVTEACLARITEYKKEGF